MNTRSLRLLTVIVLVAPIALFPGAAMAGQDLSNARPATPVLTVTAGDSLATAEALQSDQLFDAQELEELAAVESENVELQQQKAGFFGPRLGTIIIVVILLVVLL